MKKPKREIIASRLRQDILSGALKGGQRISQNDIAARYKVSRMPVREALMKLHAEGLITLDHHKGALVSVFSTEEILELFEARSLLEGLVASYAVDRLRGEDLLVLKSLLQRIDSAIDDPKKYFEINAEFHSRIKKAAGKHRVLEIIDNMRSYTQRYMLLLTTLPGVRENAQREHYEILNAMERRDKARTEQLVREHVLNGGIVLVNYLQQVNLH